MRPGFLEGDSVDALKNIDAVGGQPDLKRGTVGEVFFGHARKGRSELCQSPKNSLRILRIGLDKNVEVFGRARLSMHTIGVASDDELGSLVSVEQAKKVFEVLGEHRQPLL